MTGHDRDPCVVWKLWEQPSDSNTLLYLQLSQTLLFRCACLAVTRCTATSPSPPTRPQRPSPAPGKPTRRSSTPCSPIRGLAAPPRWPTVYQRLSCGWWRHCGCSLAARYRLAAQRTEGARTVQFGRGGGNNREENGTAGWRWVVLRLRLGW